jgi:hypothetical protein
MNPQFKATVAFAAFFKPASMKTQAKPTGTRIDDVYERVRDARLNEVRELIPRSRLSSQSGNPKF